MIHTSMPPQCDSLRAARAVAASMLAGIVIYTIIAALVWLVIEAMAQ